MRESIAEVIGISTEQIHFIFHNELTLKKVFRKMNAVFAHCRAKANLYANITVDYLKIF